MEHEWVEIKDHAANDDGHMFRCPNCGLYKYIQSFPKYKLITLYSFAITGEMREIFKEELTCDEAIIKGVLE